MGTKQAELVWFDRCAAIEGAARLALGYLEAGRTSNYVGYWIKWEQATAVLREALARPLVPVCPDCHQPTEERTDAEGTYDYCPACETSGPYRTGASAAESAKPCPSCGSTARKRIAISTFLAEIVCANCRHKLGTWSAEAES